MSISGEESLNVGRHIEYMHQIRFKSLWSTNV